MTHVLRRAVTICAAAGALAGCAGYEPFEGQAAIARPQYPIRVAQAEPSPVNPTAPYAVSAPPSQAPLATAPPPVEARPLEPAAAPVSNAPAYVTPSTPQVPPGYPLPPPTYPPAAPYAPTPAQPSYPTPAPQPPLEPAPPPPMIQRAPPVVEAPPRMLTVTKTSVTGKVVEVDGPPRTYVVQKGDHLDAIGRKVGLERDELVKLNKLKEPYRLQPGQVLKLPSGKRKAYLVVGGDTLFSIAKRFGVTAKALGAENGLKTGASLKPGQKIRLPENYRDQGPIKTVTRVPAPTPEAPPAPQYARPAPVAPAPQPPPQYARPTPAPAPPPQYARPTPAPTPAPAAPAAPRYPAYTPTTPATPGPAPAPVVRTPPPVSPPPAVRPAPGLATPPGGAIIPPSTPLSDQQITELGRGRFQWPLQGDIISAFGPRGTGQRNDGINIRGAAGQPVLAAAGGDIVYSGDQVPGFGNLVLVKHADGWVTAYGHLARTDVKMQQRVAQGQQIGQVGASGGVGEPQLHFEVRYAPTPTERARPVDPTLVLPK